MSRRTQAGRVFFQSLPEALGFHREHPDYSFEVRNKYGELEPYWLKDDVLVYVDTPFDDLNGTPVQPQDLERLQKELAVEGGSWIELEPPEDLENGADVPFMFFGDDEDSYRDRN